MNVIVIPMLWGKSDNWCYYIYTDDIKDGIYVDIAEADKITQFQKDFGIEGTPVKHLLSTHHHWDHTGGNKDIAAANPEVVITAGVEDNVDCCTQPVVDKQTFDLFNGKVAMKCIHTPCHTRGHICYYLECDTEG